MGEVTYFFYTFDVLPENKRNFVSYMKVYGNPTMSKFCKNWRFFQQKTPLTGDSIPQYIGFFEVPNVDEFLTQTPPKEMEKTIEEARKVCSNTKEWLGVEIASNTSRKR